LITILPITHGDYIVNVNGVDQLHLTKLITSPHIYAFMSFAFFSTLFLSSLLLADYSNEAREKEAFIIYRRDAMITGPLSLVSAFFILITMKTEATWLYEKMISHSTLLIISVSMFLVAGIALYDPFKRAKGDKKGWPRLAVIAIVAQYLIASYVYGISHLPYIVYPTITIKSGFTHPNTFRALFTTYIVGFLILFPGFFYFWRLFMKDKRYVRNSNK